MASKFDIKKGLSGIGKKLESLNARWIWKSIFIFIPAIYFSVLPMIGKQLHLLTMNGDRTFLGNIVSSVVFIGGFIFILASSYSTSNNANADRINSLKEEQQRSNKKIEILERVIQAKSGILHNKYSHLLQYVAKSLKRKQFEHPFMNVTQPEIQLAKIIEQMNECVHFMKFTLNKNPMLFIIVKTRRLILLSQLSIP